MNARSAEPRVTMEKPDILNRLRRQRRDRWISWLPILAFIAIGLSVPKERWKGFEQMPLPVLAWGSGILLSVAMAAVLAGRIRAFICPKCGRSFYERNDQNFNHFRRSCIHCGLKLNGQNLNE